MMNNPFYCTCICHGVCTTKEFAEEARKDMIGGCKECRDFHMIAYGMYMAKKYGENETCSIKSETRNNDNGKTA